MSRLENRIKRLEQRLERRYQENQQGYDLSFIPDRWEDFARLTTIRSGNKLIPFNPFEYQIALSNLIDRRSVVIVKSRQLGITEAIASKFLHKACLNPGYAAVVLSKSQVDTSNIARRVRRMVDSLGVALETDSLTDIQIHGGGRLIFRNSTPNGCRGLESISDILYDEAGFVEGIDRIFDAASPSQEMVGDEARALVLSTPAGKSGWYWEMLAGGNDGRDVEAICNQVKAGVIPPCQQWADESGWSKFIVHWKAHPIYSQIPNYLEGIQKKKKLSWSTIEQEYNLSFQESERNVFSSDLVRNCAVGSYSLPSKDEAYYMGIDTSNQGEDYTVAVVIKINDDGVKEVKFMYRERKRTMDYHIEKISEIIKNYRPRKIAVEVTGGTGQVYLEKLSSQHKGRDFEAVKTTATSKPVLIDRLLLELERIAILFPRECPIFDELLAYSRSPDGRLSAPSKAYDDCVMALAFALSVCPEKRHKIAFASLPTR
ncbi:MAG TPA: terminase family protein [Stenomitos sp.]